LKAISPEAIASERYAAENPNEKPLNTTVSAIAVAQKKVNPEAKTIIRFRRSGKEAFATARANPFIPQDVSIFIVKYSMIRALTESEISNSKK
jgi:hypothetical protein